MMRPPIAATGDRARPAGWAGRLTAFAVAAGRPASAVFLVLAVAAAVAVHPASAQQRPAPGDDLDPVARLQAALDGGAPTPSFDPVTGWLPAVLEALDVPVSSQTLVFSRTSLQTDRIGPWAPRALYFNDEVYVGYVQDGGLLEVAAVEPTGGVAFYSVAQASADRLRFHREDGNTCLMCHASRAMTGGVPGLLLRSVLTDRLGYPIAEIHDGSTTLRTPVERRWGGWYVTGVDPAAGHAGNAWAPDLRHEVADVERYLAEFAFDRRRAETPVERRFDAAPYLSPHGDAVALAVLSHQVDVHNRIAQAHEASRQAVREAGGFGRAAADTLRYDDLTPAGRIRVDGAAGRLVDALLFVGEASWPSGVGSVSGFPEEFEAGGPADPEGRSLREFDLERRLFRHPLSYLIYTRAFATLPRAMAERVHGRLSAVLSGADRSEAYAHLEGPTRQAILEILAETLPSFSMEEPAG